MGLPERFLVSVNVSVNASVCAHCSTHVQNVTMCYFVCEKV
jgi:hypothetical protein